MNLNTALLQSLALGLAITATTTSCESVNAGPQKRKIQVADTLQRDTLKITPVVQNDTTEAEQHWKVCRGCGRG